MSQKNFNMDDIFGGFYSKFEDYESANAIEQNMHFDPITITTTVSALLIVLIMCLLFCLRSRKRRRQTQTRSDHMQSISSHIYTVPTNYCSVSPNRCASPPPCAAPPAGNTHHRISSVGDRFAIPLDLLPPAFDYSAPGVEHKGSYVLIRDLRMIQTPNLDEYQKQAPYNPHFS